MSDFDPAYSLDRVRPWGANPRAIDSENSDRLRESLERFGPIKPIIIEADGNLLAGHQRSTICLDIGRDHFPAFVVPVLNKRARTYFVQVHNQLYEHPGPEPDIRLESTESGEFVPADIHVNGDPFNGWGHKPRRLMECWQRVIREAGMVGTVTANRETGRIYDGHLFAIYCHLAGHKPLTHFMDEDPAEFLTPAGDYEGDFGIRAGRHTRPRSRPRGYSPLYRRMLDGWEREDPRVLDIGCGFGRHFPSLPDDVKPFGYEPWINPVDDVDAYDVVATRQQIEQIAMTVRSDGLFPRIVVDHVLFVTQDEDITRAIIGSAAAMVAADGEVWVSQRLPDGEDRVNKKGWMFGSIEGRQYRMRAYSREEMAALLGEQFGSVEWQSNAGTVFYCCRDPLTRDMGAVRTEFDLPYPGDVHHGAGDFLIETLEAAR